MNKIVKTIELAKKQLTLETGNLALQATASVLGRYGDTMVLSTVVEGGLSDLGYFPLTVEYVERLYAGGKIKGSRWVKREGRPSDEAILTARLIDRSIRPLFPKGYKNDVQVVITVLSVDGENPPDILSLITTSAALAISPIPWNGPIGGVRVGMVKEENSENLEFLINPTSQELDLSELDLILSQTSEKTVMIEAGAKQVSEENLLAAIKKGTAENKKILDLISDLAKSVGVAKKQALPDEELEALISEVEKDYKKELEDEVGILTKKEGGGPSGLLPLVDKILEEKTKKEEMPPPAKSKILKALDEAVHKKVREQILASKKRPDGRSSKDIRPISSTVGVLPRTHGSAIFNRGDTQALTVVTLGSPSLGQLIESAEGEETKRYMHHYSMPPYSVGETGRMGYPSRREIGHGALAERALLPVIPLEDKFPYTIRVVSEIMSSNGSTSMASTCGSTLSLMDAGVPITSPVSGIAMGLVSKGKDYIILSDISGLEDFSGEMDFKVAGTKDGITAVQLDVKNDGLSEEILAETLTQAKVGRLFILDKMLDTIETARSSVSQFAPKVEVLRVETDKIGEVIGPGGRIIRGIIAQTGATVDVEDDGRITITGINQDQVKKAVEFIKGITVEVQPGQEFEGEVKRILPFGAFVEIIPGKEGMIHVSKMGEGFVRDPGEVVKIGQKVKVFVDKVDDMGRINLSMGIKKQAPSPESPVSRIDHLRPKGPRFKRRNF